VNTPNLTPFPPGQFALKMDAGRRFPDGRMCGKALDGRSLDQTVSSKRFLPPGRRLIAAEEEIVGDLLDGHTGGRQGVAGLVTDDNGRMALAVRFNAVPAGGEDFLVGEWMEGRFGTAATGGEAQGGAPGCAGESAAVHLARRLGSTTATTRRCRRHAERASKLTSPGTPFFRAFPRRR
jgi:hypothetical protein